VTEPLSWSATDERPLQRIARNVATRYLLVVVEMAIGLVTLPFNLHHLGQEAYGLWMLTAGVTMHFSLLDLGYGGAMVKFVAQYRAHRDARALNEIASTIFVLFAAIGLVTYLGVIALALNLDSVFNLTPAQASTGKWILLIVGAYVASNFAFGTFGGICSGFQRYDINNNVGTTTTIVAAAVNLLVIWLGFGLIPLVAATTTVRMVALFIYRRNAYKVFPPLKVRPSLFRRARLREVTSFSIYAAIIDWANKLNYEIDEVVIGFFMGVAPVAVWAVADRIISATQRLTNQGNTVLFPVVVDSDASNREERLRTVLLEGTRLSLALVAPIAMVLVVMAEPIVRRWVGSSMDGAVPVIQILAVAVTMRVANATGTTVLKGAGSIRSLAMINLATGLANLVLSALLIRPYGLVGVAVGTLIPIAISSSVVIFPRACRRVGLPLGIAVRRAVLPTIWPAVAVGILLYSVHVAMPGGIVVAMLQAAAACWLYAALFVIAVGRKDREVYTARILELAT
jgi:O-antigen/teichoic acid export membrane protein